MSGRPSGAGEGGRRVLLALPWLAAAAFALAVLLGLALTPPLQQATWLDASPLRPQPEPDRAAGRPRRRRRGTAALLAFTLAQLLAGAAITSATLMLHLSDSAGVVPTVPDGQDRRNCWLPDWMTDRPGRHKVRAIVNAALGGTIFDDLSGYREFKPTVEYVGHYLTAWPRPTTPPRSSACTAARSRASIRFVPASR